MKRLLTLVLIAALCLRLPSFAEDAVHKIG